MLDDLGLKQAEVIVACNGCAIGPRLSRGTPMPPYQTSYDDTPEGRSLAEYHMAQIEKYVLDLTMRTGSKSDVDTFRFTL
jgi:hypothetical protein